MFALIIRDGDVVGRAFYSDYNDNLPEDQIECAQEQHENWQAHTIKNGKITKKDKAALDAEELERQKLTVQAQLSALLVEAAAAISPLQDAVDLDIAMDEEVERLTAWKKYRVLLNRVAQQPGFPTQIEWPIKPE